MTSVDGYEFFNGPVVGFFDLWWKYAAWKLVSFQMISYTFTAISPLVTSHISASAVLRVDLYIWARLSCAHFGNLNFPGLREVVYNVAAFKHSASCLEQKLDETINRGNSVTTPGKDILRQLWLEREGRSWFHFEKPLFGQFVVGLVEFP